VHQRKDRLFYANHLGRDYRIHSVVVYPEYGLSEESRHDVALIQLKKNVNDGNLVKLYSQKNEQGQLVVFVGKGKFGNGREGYIEYDGKQRGATNKIIGVDQHWIEFKFDGGDNATELEGISGSGDSGGPAFITSGTDLFVAGVSSYQELNGYDKATYGVSEFYARVSSYTEWIHSVIEN